ncbi:MAG: Hpt domain-containing protein [Ruminococcus sp.]|nr:Hpt domain-containing protein [Ruminococcus sp.]
MLDIQSLKEFGANTEEGIARCMGAEDFYLSLVGTVTGDKRLGELEKALAAKDLDAAFEHAHALKGMYGNLSLTPLFEPVNEMTELLRSRTDTDYSELLAKAKEKFAELRALAE